MRGNDNSTATVYKLLNRLRVPVTQVTFREELESHPDHPSLLAISDVLRQWEVHNSAYRVGVDELNQVVCPFIAHLSANGEEFVMVQSIGNDGEWYQTKGGQAGK
jgi:ABC-type bacteriocin/lantibiotic exporter with double-glycine peptidase domain